MFSDESAPDDRESFSALSLVAAIFGGSVSITEAGWKFGRKKKGLTRKQKKLQRKLRRAAKGKKY